MFVLFLFCLGLGLFVDFVRVCKVKYGNFFNENFFFVIKSLNFSIV